MRQKTAIVTGGNRGIGLSITKELVDANYYVIVGARTDNDLGNKFPKNVLFVNVDLNYEESHKELVEIAIKQTGSLDLYVNNVGVSEWRSIDKIDNNFLDKILATNLKSAFWGCKVAANSMKEGSNIINISSLAGKRGSKNNSAYCAAKFGMNGLTQSLAKELGPSNIRVNALCPVLISTDGLMEALNKKDSPANGNPNEFIKNFAKTNAALERLPSGREVGSMCVLLSSDDASAITGQCINVDCGVLPQ